MSKPSRYVWFSTCAALAYGCGSNGSSGGCNEQQSESSLLDAASSVELMDGSSEIEETGVVVATDAATDSENESEKCVKGLDVKFAPGRLFWNPRGVVAKNERTFYFARPGISPSGNPCSAQYPYAVLGRQSFDFADPTQISDAAASEAASGFLCVVPPNQSSPLPLWEAQGAAYAAAGDRVALNAVRPTDGSAFAAIVSGADPSWQNSSFNGKVPSQMNWGTFPSPPPSTPQTPPVLNASTYDGHKLWVVGATAAGEALSILFSEGAAAANGATLQPTAFSETRAASFNAVAGNANGVVVGGFNSSGALVIEKLTASNVPDSAFGTAGIATPPFTDAKRIGIALDSQGRVLAVASNEAGATFLARLTANGSLDESFGTKGIVSLILMNPRGAHLDLAIDSEGGILAGGLLPESDGKYLRGAVARVLPNGILDPTFGNGGVAATSPYPNDGEQLYPSRVMLSLADSPTKCARRVVLSVIVEDETASTGYAYAFVP